MELLNSVLYFKIRSNQGGSCVFFFNYFIFIFYFFYPEPSFISAVVCLALLLPLPPLDQAGGMVTGKADVTAAGGGADSSSEAS